MNVTPRAEVARLTAYRPGRQDVDEVGRLASNESPWGTSPSVAQAVCAAATALHRYPDPYADRLRHRLAQHHDVHPDQILVGSGSDELIYLLTWAYAAGGGRVVCADPAYQLDVLVPKVAGASVLQVPLRGWTHDLEAMASFEADLAFVVNPHNPTGTVVTAEDVAAFVDAARARLTVVDEAYIDFADVGSALPLAREGKAVVLRTFSKLHGLAGARVGYLIGAADVVAALRKVRAPFSVGTLAEAAAVAALEDQEFSRRTRAATRRNRDRLGRLLQDHGLNPVPSQANFVLVPGVEERDFAQHFRRHDLIVRPGSHLGVPGSIRLTVPDDDGLERIGRALSALPGRPRTEPDVTPSPCRCPRTLDEEGSTP